MTTKTYNLGKISQLIDLNDTMTNFVSDFEIKSLQKKPIQLAVVTQTQLDSGNLEFRDLENGFLAGSVSSDDDVYQNYFLVLNAKEETEAEVTVNTREIPKKQEENDTPQHSVQSFDQATEFNKEHPAPEKTNWVKIILIIVVLLIGLSLLYYFYTRSNIKSSSPKFVSEISNDVIAPGLELPSRPSLLDRLNKLPI